MNFSKTDIKEKMIWILCIFLTVAAGVINSVWVVFLLEKIVEVILRDGIHSPYLLVIFILSVIAGALLEIIRQKLRYVLYQKRVVKLEDRLISVSHDIRGEGNNAFVLIQNTVNDLVTKKIDWTLECWNIFGVAIMLSVYICYISFQAFLICLLITVIGLLTMWKSNQKIPDASKKSTEKTNAVYAEMWNYLKCKEILPFLKSNVYDKYEEKLKDNQQSQIVLGKNTNTARVCMRFSSIGILLVAILYFGILTIRGQFTLPELLAVTMLLPNLAESLLKVPNCIAEYKKLAGMEENVTVFIKSNLQENVEEKELLEEKITSIAAANIEFSYQEGDCHCHVGEFLAQSGSTIGICGESGVGKTTLLKIILGELKGNRGECRINDRDVRRLDKDHLWSHILYLPQIPVILPVSFKENITLVSDKGLIDEKKYFEAIKKADIDGLAAEKGDDNLGNAALSSGEIQKICLARCFYSEKEVIILDEATNAMSPNAEKYVLQNLIKEVTLKNKILILVSHNPAVIDLCDRSFLIEAVGNAGK